MKLALYTNGNLKKKGFKIAQDKIYRLKPNKMEILKTVHHCEYCTKQGSIFHLCLVKINGVIVVICPDCLKTLKTNVNLKIEST